MLDLATIRKHPETIREALEARSVAFDLEEFLVRESRRRDLIHRVEGLKADRNQAGKRIGELKKAGQDASEIITTMTEVSNEIRQIDVELEDLEERIQHDLLDFPNIPESDVPVGSDESENRLERTWGEPPQLDFTPLDHVAIGEALGILDLTRAAKLAGARFPTQFGDGARLERALAHFMLDLHRARGYLEVAPPVLVKPTTMQFTGQLPKFQEESFYIERDELYLIPTSEVPLVNLHSGEILAADDLPIRYCAHTPCFRREAGSYGRDTRGLIRVHQFNKVELVWFSLPERSGEDLEDLTTDAEKVLQALKLPYRVVSLCTGDLGFAASKTYDLEVWLPSQDRYREISSCSNCRDFQARRGDIRYRPAADTKPRLVHTLNGSGVAVGRALVAVLEVHQQRDGTVLIPAALRPYLDGMESIEPLRRPGA